LRDVSSYLKIIIWLTLAISGFFGHHGIPLLRNFDADNYSFYARRIVSSAFALCNCNLNAADAVAAVNFPPSSFASLGQVGENRYEFLLGVRLLLLTRPLTRFFGLRATAIADMTTRLRFLFLTAPLDGRPLPLSSRSYAQRRLLASGAIIKRALSRGGGGAS